MTIVPPDDSRLGQVLADYLRAVEAGRTVDREANLRQHPDLADELRSYFANRDALDKFVSPLQDAALEATVGLNSAAETLPRVRYFGDYELLAELGRGGMGVVYKARQTTLNRPVALKMILAGQTASAEDVRRFKDEAEAAANLDHPHIAPIYETGEQDGRHYFSMKLIEGRSLRDALPELRADVRTGVRLLGQVARGVHHAHQRGVLHRDLKPANVLLDRDGAPFVTDFGLAKRVEGGSDVTRTGAIVGTPSYMAPEQASGEKQLSTAVDVYSLGAMLYELLTSRPPFRGDSPLETLMQTMSREPDRPRSIDSRADRDLETISLKSLEKDPARRYDSAAAFADDLERWLRGEPILARPASSWERGVKWARRRPAAAGVIGVTLLAIAALVATLAVSNRRIREEKQLAIDAGNAARKSEADADAARRTAERRLYGSQIRLAQSALDQVQVGQARQALASTAAEQRGWEWDYLNGLCNGSVRTIPIEHERAIRLTFSPDGEALGWTDLVQARWMPLRQPRERKHRLATLAQGLVSGDPHPNVAWTPDLKHYVVASKGGLAIWEPAAERETVLVPPLPPEENRALETPTTAVAISNDGEFAYHAGKGKLTCWSKSSREKVWEVPLDGTDCWAVALSPDGERIAAGAKATSAWVFDVKTKERLLVTAPLRNHITSLAFTADGKRLVAASGFDDPQLYDIDGKKLIARLKAEDGQTGFITVLSPDRSLAASGFGRGLIVVWNTTTGAKLHTLRGHIAFINALAFSTDGKRLASGGRDKVISLWDLEKGNLIRNMVGHREAVTSVTFSHDGATLASAGDEYELRLWDLRRPDVPLQLKTGWGGVYDWTYAAPDQLFLGGYWDGKKGGAIQYDVASGEKVREFVPHGDEVHRLGLSRDAKMLVTAGDEGTICLWEIATGERRATLGQVAQRPEEGQFRRNQIKVVALSPNGDRVLASTFGGAVTCWDVATAKPLWRRNTPDWRNEESEDLAGPDRCEFAADGKLVIVSCEARLRVCDAATGDPIYQSPLGDRGMIQWDVSADGQTLAAAAPREDVSMHQELTLIDLPSARVRNKFGLYAGIDAFALSRDGRFIAIAYRTINVQTPMIELWDTATEKRVWSSTGHERVIAALAFFPDGKRLVSGSMDHTVKIWDTVEGQELLSLPLGSRPDAGVQRVIVTPEGRRILATDGGGPRAIGSLDTVLIWSAPTNLPE